MLRALILAWAALRGARLLARVTCVAVLASVAAGGFSLFATHHASPELTQLLHTARGELARLIEHAPSVHPHTTGGPQ
jgi:hypothetical protein